MESKWERHSLFSPMTLESSIQISSDFINRCKYLKVNWETKPLLNQREIFYSDFSVTFLKTTIEKSSKRQNKYDFSGCLLDFFSMILRNKWSPSSAVGVVVVQFTTDEPL